MCKTVGTDVQLDDVFCFTNFLSGFLFRVRGRVRVRVRARGGVEEYESRMVIIPLLIRTQGSLGIITFSSSSHFPFLRAIFLRQSRTVEGLKRI